MSLSQIAGDFDSDGDVDGDDFLAWRNGFPISAGATLLDGDADADGDVDGDDFLMWQNSFPYPTAISSVPEPNSLVLLALGGLLMLRLQRRTQTRSANLRITRGLGPATNRAFSIS